MERPPLPIPLDTILAMTTLYWFTSTFPRALYHAELVKNVLAGKPHPISKEKPMGYSLFPCDLVLLPKAWAREIYPNLVLYETHDKVSALSTFFFFLLVGWWVDGRGLTCIYREGISGAWNSQRRSWRTLRSLSRR
jgi:hypothetical protein